MRFGIHMPLKGGFPRNVKRAAEIGCQSLQIFVGNPTAWSLPRVDREELERRRLVLDKYGIEPLIVHAAYLVNLAAAKKDFYEKSCRLLRDTMERAYLLGSPYVVMHVGSHGGRGFKEGLDLFISTLQGEIENWPPHVELLLENTSGAGTSLGGSFISIGHILGALGDDAPVGVCLDTAHAWAAGYDLSFPEGLQRSMEELKEHVGLENIKVLHINDINTPRGSHRDRHSHLGEGLIGAAGLKAFLGCPWPEEMPAVLETPEMGTHWDAVNLSRLRLYAGDTS